MVITLANGQQRNVTPTNQAAVTGEAIDAAESVAQQKGQAFGYTDQVAIMTAVGEAANGVSVAQPSDYTFFGSGSTSVLGQVQMQNEAIDQNLWDTVSNAANNVADTVKNALPSNTTITVWLVVGVVGLLAVAYIAHKSL